MSCRKKTKKSKEGPLSFSSTVASFNRQPRAQNPAIRFYRRRQYDISKKEQACLDLQRRIECIFGPEDPDVKDFGQLLLPAGTMPCRVGSYSLLECFYPLDKSHIMKLANYVMDANENPEWDFPDAFSIDCTEWGGNLQKTQFDRFVVQFQKCAASYNLKADEAGDPRMISLE